MLSLSSTPWAEDAGPTPLRELGLLPLLLAEKGVLWRDCAPNRAFSLFLQWQK